MCVETRQVCDASDALPVVTAGRSSPVLAALPAHFSSYYEIQHIAITHSPDAAAVTPECSRVSVDGANFIAALHVHCKDSAQRKPSTPKHHPSITYLQAIVTSSAVCHFDIKFSFRVVDSVGGKAGTQLTYAACPDRPSWFYCNWVKHHCHEACIFRALDDEALALPETSITSAQLSGSVFTTACGSQAMRALFINDHMVSSDALAASGGLLTAAGTLSFVLQLRVQSVPDDDSLQLTAAIQACMDHVLRTTMLALPADRDVAPGTSGAPPSQLVRPQYESQL